jgi:hypothetical protein
MLKGHIRMPLHYIEKIKEVINLLIQQLNALFISNRLDCYKIFLFYEKVREKTCQGNQKIGV